MYILVRKTDTVYLVNSAVTITNKCVTNKDVLGLYNSKNMCRKKMRLEEWIRWGLGHFVLKCWGKKDMLKDLK